MKQQLDKQGRCGLGMEGTKGKEGGGRRKQGETPGKEVVQGMNERRQDVKNAGRGT